MAFGQQAGPPASRREVQELLTLLHDAGHTDFRDAGGPACCPNAMPAVSLPGDPLRGMGPTLSPSVP